MIAVHDDGPVRHLVLSRPERRNAITAGLARALGAALEEAAAAKRVAVVVIRGSGPSFSSGIDLDEFRSFQDPDVFRSSRNDILAAWNLCEQIPKPTIAQIHGAAVGVGCELALACDLRVIADDATIGLPETRYGAVPDVGGSSRLAALVGLGRAKELIMTSALITGREAERIGLANRAVPADGLEAAVAGLCQRLLSCSPTAVGLAKQVIDAAAKPALQATLVQELEFQVRIIAEEGLRTDELQDRLRLGRK